MNLPRPIVREAFIAELPVDCLGSVVTFLDSSRTFFHLLALSSHTKAFFEGYGGSCCENVNFRLVNSRVQYMTEERLRGKGYIQCVTVGEALCKRNDFGFFAFLDHVRTIRVSNPRISISSLALQNLPNRANLTSVAIELNEDSDDESRREAALRLLAEFSNLSAVDIARSGFHDPPPRELLSFQRDLHPPKKPLPRTVDLPPIALRELTVRGRFGLGSICEESVDTLENLTVVLKKWWRKMGDHANALSGSEFSLLGVPMLRNLSVLVLQVGVVKEDAGYLFELIPRTVRKLGLKLRRTSYCYGHIKLTKDLVRLLPACEDFVFTGCAFKSDFLLGLPGQNVKSLRLAKTKVMTGGFLSKKTFEGMDQLADKLTSFSLRGFNSWKLDVFRTLSCLKSLELIGLDIHVIRRDWLPEAMESLRIVRSPGLDDLDLSRFVNLRIVEINLPQTRGSMNHVKNFSIPSAEEIQLTQFDFSRIVFVPSMLANVRRISISSCSEEQKAAIREICPNADFPPSSQIVNDLYY